MNAGAAVGAGYPDGGVLGRVAGRAVGTRPRSGTASR